MQAQASVKPAAEERIVAYLIADDAPSADWLREMGVEAVDEKGAWRLTALGDAAMARFYGRAQPPRIVTQR